MQYLAVLYFPSPQSPGLFSFPFLFPIKPAKGAECEGVTKGQNIPKAQKHGRQKIMKENTRKLMNIYELLV